MSPSPAREVATRVLYRVAEQGAWVAPTLDAELRRGAPDGRDAALATEIVYGALRALPWIDEAISAHLRRPSAPMDGWVRAALRAAAHQLLRLDRVPAHAVVDDTVSIVRRERGPRVAGFANAVLRKLAAPAGGRPAPPEGLLLPHWVLRELEASCDPARVRAFVEQRPLPPAIGLRAPTAERRGACLERLRVARPAAELEEGRVSPLCILARRAGDPRTLPGVAEGELAIQEQGAQAVALLAGARAGETVADACCGRGGKTTLLAERVGPTGSVMAIDLHEAKLERLGDELGRLHIPAERVQSRTLDLSVGTGGLGATFDRVLVDAPCTGLGTVHRRPELLLRLDAQDPARMGALQGAILGNAAALVRPGGALCFAVCSPLHAEGARVVEAFLDRRPGFARADAPSALAGAPADADGAIRIGPWSGECDAYQVFRLVRRT